MNHRATWFLCLLGLTFAAAVPAAAQSSSRPSVVRYTLLEGSYFVDNCLICERPTVLQPLRGTFDLVLVQDTPPYTEYAVRNLEFTTSPGFWGEARITGEGTYVRFEEFARIQRMDLKTEVRDAYTNQTAYFTNTTPIALRPWPLIETTLMQTNGRLFQTFSMELIAAPLREIWFSTTRALTSTNRFSPTNKVSPGDLISNRGRVVKRNGDLVQRLGVMPMVPDLGLDAVQVIRRGEILYSIPNDVWSETLGLIRHGDLLSDRGAVVKRNRDLLQAFGVSAAQPDAGLDAVQMMPDGEILFSTRSNVTVNSSLTLARGDILSDRGRVFRTQRSLLAAFQPAVTNRDYGVDAFCVLPGGEIWFSVEEGFTDLRLGAINQGDLLSSLGHRVFSNAELVAAFTPADPSLDYGLDALFVITDMKLPAPPPRIWRLRPDRVGGVIGVDWDGDGDVFQLQHANSPAGPWDPCGPILPGLSFEDACDPNTHATHFFRLQQW